MITYVGPSATAWSRDLETDVVVVGAGGCGLTAAIAAAQGGAEVVVLEKARKPLSNTARSGGMIPAAGTRFQREAGVVESAEDFVRDIVAKNHGASDAARTLHLARTSTELVEWLVDGVGVGLTFVHDFKYPGHTQFRMHAPKSRTGAELVDALRNAVTSHPRASIVTGAPAVGLIADADGAVVGVVARQGGETGAGETMRIAAKKVILACNGYAGSPAMLAEHCPEIASAMYFGGEGSTGEGLAWGEALGGRVAFMDAYQAHASVAHPLGVLITYAVVMEGGVHVNLHGARFADETRGYSEHALDVLKQPDGAVVEIYDARIHDLAMTFDDYREANAAGVVKSAPTLDALARAFALPEAAVAATIAAYHDVADGTATDAFGRTRDRARRLTGPFYGVRVTGALFHTQGGLEVDPVGRVLRRTTDGRADGVVPNLYAGGGVAAGISGHGPGGYLSGNGLLTALAYGMLAGRDAAARIRAGG